MLFYCLKTITMTQNYTTIKFFADVKQLNLIFILVGLDARRSTVMIIDTGAEENQIFEYLYEEAEELFTKTGNISILHGIGGEFESFFVQGKITLNKKDYTSDFAISCGDTGKTLSESMGFPIGGLIGTKFMAKHGWIIDYGKQEILIPEI